MTTILHRPRVIGRHRLGRPGLVPLSALVTIRRRSFFTSWFRSGKHRHGVIPASKQAATPFTLAVPAQAQGDVLELAAA
ncbi:MAG: hypothetical protein ABJD68_17290 [Nakamurella sp.]